MTLRNAVIQQDTTGHAQVGTRRFPSGGPYSHRELGEFWVGELWVLAGQSNMKGVGRLVHLEASIPQVRSFDMNEHWQQAQEPLHHHADSPRHIYTRDMPRITRPERPDGAGLGLTFAKERYRQTGVPIGLIPCARGNTSMAEWSPQRRDPHESLYGAMLDRIRSCGGKLQGVLWYQGESDAIAGYWAQYQQHMDALVHALHTDLEQPDLPFLMVQLSRYATTPDPELTLSWNAVREQQRTWAAGRQDVQIVSAIDLELTDPIHLNTRSLKRLGSRLVRASFGSGALTPCGLTWECTPRRQHVLRLDISGVSGELKGMPRPLGFSLRDASGNDLYRIYYVELEQNSVLLHMDERPLPDEAKLWYGYGLDPVCNVVDGTDQALVSFGPLPLPPVQELR